MRITDKQLSAIVTRLNHITASPTESYTKTDSGLVANVGNYHLDYSYGGVRLVQMVNEFGGITGCGPRGTKREIYDQIRSFMNGYLSALAHCNK